MSVFTTLCDLTDELQRLTRDVEPERVRLEALVNRLDAMIDQTIGMGDVVVVDPDEELPEEGGR